MTWDDVVDTLARLTADQAQHERDVTTLRVKLKHLTTEHEKLKRTVGYMRQAKP